jgi:hypothetical protein
MPLAKTIVHPKRFRMPTYWERVKDYRYDPFMCHSGGIPFPPVILPWLFPTTRVWLAAFWFALFNKDLYNL